MSTPSVAQARADLAAADMLFDAQQVNDSIDKLATELTEQLGEKFPYVLAVMGGAVIFTGQLLPRLNFPLDFSYVHVSRYSDRRHGGELIWKQAPPEEIRGRDVLVLDDGQRSYTFQEGEWAAPVVKVRDAEASASPERGD